MSYSVTQQSRADAGPAADVCMSLGLVRLGLLGFRVAASSKQAAQLCLRDPQDSSNVLRRRLALHEHAYQVSQFRLTRIRTFAHDSLLEVIRTASSFQGNDEPKSALIATVAVVSSAAFL